MKHRWLALLLAICICLGFVPQASAVTEYDDTISVDAIFAAAYDFFAGHEGHYNSVVAKDSNAVSIGRLQWHATRAHGLLKRIVDRNPSKIAALLSEDLYNEIVNEPDSAWKNRSMTKAEAAQIQAVLSTTESIDAQDELAYLDICLYISYAWNAGFRSNATIMYYASVLNQYGTGGAKTHFLIPLREYLGLTSSDTISSLELVHDAVLNSDIGYKSSRQKVYNYIVNNTDWNTEGPDEPGSEFALPPCASGHSWDGGVVLTAPTCTDSGSKKYTCTVCGLTTVETVPATGYSRPSEVFTDVAEDDWFREAVDYVLTHGIFKGTSPTTFSPDDSMTRAMLVTVIYRMAGKPYVEGTSAFTDVRIGSYYEKAVLWGAMANIVYGVSETSFAPTNDVTREQVITFLYRYADWIGVFVPPSMTSFSGFEDSGRISRYAKKPMLWAIENGLLDGTLGENNSQIRPRDAATRAEVAMILMNFCRNIQQIP